MISLVTYYDEKYELSHKLLIKSAKKCKFDKTFNYTYNDLDNKFKNKNKKILKCKRGAGY